MALLKILIVVGNIIFGIYYIIKGFEKGKKEGFSFDIKNLFKNISFSKSSSGLLIAEGIFGLVVALIFYLVFF